MVPSLNFTVRPARSEVAPVISARADTLDSAAMVALTAASDEPSAAPSALNSRRLSNCLLAAKPRRPMTTDVPIYTHACCHRGAASAPLWIIAQRRDRFQAHVSAAL